MTTGTSLDLRDRVKKIIPKGWFKYIAPYRDAIVGGLADSAAWGYTLILYARAQTRLATAYGIWLDIFAYDFLGSFLVRHGLSDDIFRAFIRATILQERVTRKGMISAILSLTGNTPTVFEPWNTNDTGAYSGSGLNGVKYGSMGYGVGQGGYGSMNLPAQVFIKVTRGSPSGVPGVGGYTNNVDGYGVGKGEYIGSLLALVGITNSLIYQLISMTKPTGSTAWVAIGAPVLPQHHPCQMSSKANSQNIVII